MQFRSNVIHRGSTGLMALHYALEDICIGKRCIISVDASTDNTGYAIIDITSGELICTMQLKRESENLAQYGMKSQYVLGKIFEQCPSIEYIVYEEPFIQWVQSATVLIGLRAFYYSFVEEQKAKGRVLEMIEIANTKWKKVFLAPKKLPPSSAEHKGMIASKFKELFPNIEVTQDEMDASGLGLSFIQEYKEKGLGGVKEELVSKAKVHPFKYNVEFLGADSLDDCLEELSYCMNGYKIPKKVMENGLKVESISSRGKFDNYVYKAMGESDCLLLVEFKSNTHANVILEHKLGYLAEDYDYLYALIWRKSRKQ